MVYAERSLEIVYDFLRFARSLIRPRYLHWSQREKCCERERERYFVNRLMGEYTYLLTKRNVGYAYANEGRRSARDDERERWPSHEPLRTNTRGTDTIIHSTILCFASPIHFSPCHLVWITIIIRVVTNQSIIRINVLAHPALCLEALPASRISRYILVLTLSTLDSYFAYWSEIVTVTVSFANLWWVEKLIFQFYE